MQPSLCFQCGQQVQYAQQYVLFIVGGLVVVCVTDPLPSQISRGEGGEGKKGSNVDWRIF